MLPCPPLPIPHLSRSVGRTVLLKSLCEFLRFPSIYGVRPLLAPLLSVYSSQRSRRVLNHSHCEPIQTVPPLSQPSSPAFKHPLHSPQPCVKSAVHNHLNNALFSPVPSARLKAPFQNFVTQFFPNIDDTCCNQVRVPAPTDN